MNNQRRKAIRKVIAGLEEGQLEWETVESELSNLLDDETEAMENIPESMQDGDKYQVCEESVDLLDQALSVDPDDLDWADTVVELLSQIDGV